MPMIDTALGRAFYAAQGEAGPALICIHGAGGSHRHWGHILGGLGDLSRVYAVDLPGHGRSDPPGRDSISGYVEFLFALMDALGLERALLAGHSMGGAIALSAAAARPERVSGLVLAGASARLRVLPALIAGLASDPGAAVTQLEDMLYADDAPAELRAAGAAEAHSCDPLVFRDDFIACDGFDIRPRLAELRMPALVIAGAEDRMVPPKLSAELVAGLAGARQVTVSGAGHMPMVERPAEVIAAIRGWLPK
ncbi:alpha/beta fold hydrolase [Oscillochloris sp. ZM17-4]|uniref:alpha/beta fold hydrolase n=1 Tax=Oscillochloris sp. ZM17-4 TaxID=2866714 RepID=UPI001C72B2BC|nr:alpha/beta fold hydrolase [Oscillochloris sp. ZM17-4]MBX0330056.1 alpha/beta fold hydrolase [Oscillochloris sp. ZM17-4]